jgi:HlyD family secretion protein
VSRTPPPSGAARSRPETTSVRTPPATRAAAKPGVLLGYSVQPKPAVLGAGTPSKAPARPTPAAHRPKGRWFMGSFVLGLLGLVAFRVWNTFLRYEAYGIVAGRELEVVAPWLGAVEAVQVREGESVRQGQVLCTLSNLGLAQERRRLQDELRVVQADLALELARLQLERVTHADRLSEARAEYHEAWGELLAQQARADDLQRRYARQVQLYQSGVVSEEALEELREEAGGAADRVAELARGVEQRRLRSELAGGPGEERLRPHAERVRMLEAELERVAERLQQGEVRAPSNGTIVRRECFVGELASPERALFVLLEEGSERIDLYVQQAQADELALGAEVELELEPYGERVLCRVEHRGEAFVPPPSNVGRFALAGELFLPIALLPSAPPGERPELCLGALAKLPELP